MGKRLLIAGFSVGALLGVLGLVGVIVAPSFINNFVTSNIKLEPGYDLYNQWLNPPINIYLTFYVYDLKNPDDFLKGARPVIEEIGPIVYREHITKEQVMDNQNGTISYFERRRYEFNSELSKFNESYQITTVNVAPVTVLQLIKYFPGIAHDLLNAAFITTNDTFVVRKTIQEILFGYKDNLLATLRDLAGIFQDLLPSDEVGFFIGKNNSFDGYFNIFTGADDYKKVGLVQSWNHLDKMVAWTSDTANMINGTDGTVLPPFIEKDKRLYIFNSDLCRSLYLVYNKTEKLIDDIEVYTFAPEPRLFAFHTDNPDNEGFCTPKGNCLPAGVLNLTACQAGVPIIMSSPHFLFADPKFLKDVDGLVPDERLHNTYLSVDPITGVLMKANKRLQFNMQLFRDSRVDMTKNLPEILYPLFWVDENFEIDQVNADKYRSQVMIPLSVLNIGKFVVFGLGLFIILACGIYMIHWRKQQRENKSDRVPMINSSNQDFKRNGNSTGLNSIAEDEAE